MKGDGRNGMVGRGVEMVGDGGRWWGMVGDGGGWWGMVRRMDRGGGMEMGECWRWWQTKGFGIYTGMGGPGAR